MAATPPERLDAATRQAWSALCAAHAPALAAIDAQGLDVGDIATVTVELVDFT